MNEQMYEVVGEGHEYSTGTRNEILVQANDLAKYFTEVEQKLIRVIERLDGKIYLNDQLFAQPIEN